MKRILLLLFICCLCYTMHAQTVAVKTETYTDDSVVQLYGVVMTADSLLALPNASVVVVGKGRGTITNDQGVFSIAVLKGDVVEFSSVGYKNKEVIIPRTLDGKDFSMVQLMADDTAYLPGTVIKPRPSRAQFERDFINADIPYDQYEIARQNTEANTRRILLSTLPADGREAVNYTLRQQANKVYYSGQIAPMNILNPFAWGEFVKAWKRGDFKKKKKS